MNLPRAAPVIRQDLENHIEVDGFEEAGPGGPRPEEGVEVAGELEIDDRGEEDVEEPEQEDHPAFAARLPEPVRVAFCGCHGILLRKPPGSGASGRPETRPGRGAAGVSCRAPRAGNCWSGSRRSGS